MEECYFTYQNSKEKSKTKPYKKDYINVEIFDMEGNKKDYRLTKNKELIKPMRVLSFSKLSDIELEREIIRLEGKLNFGEEEKRTEIAKKLELAYLEKQRRSEV